MYPSNGVEYPSIRVLIADHPLDAPTRSPGAAMNLATKNKFENILNEAKHHFAAGTPESIARALEYLQEAQRVAEIELALAEVLK